MGTRSGAYRLHSLEGLPMRGGTPSFLDRAFFFFFFSSNFDMKQLENEHLRTSQRGEDEPLKAKRIMERIRYLAKEINMTGKNRRNY